MFEPAPAPSPSGAPSPPAVGSNPRYVYLLSRLRNRQITMEEATELFAVQQSMIRSPASRPEMGPAGSTPAPAVATAAGRPVLSDDTLVLGMLALGAGAGVLAAILRRAGVGPPKPSPPSAP